MRYRSVLLLAREWDVLITEQVVENCNGSVSSIEKRNRKLWLASEKLTQRFFSEKLMRENCKV